MCFLASLYGGVSTPLTEDHIWTILPQTVWVSPGKEEDRPGSLSQSGDRNYCLKTRLLHLCKAYFHQSISPDCEHS